MKKDFRFLKSLALTGMLATTILGNVAYADTENKDVKTEPLGIYNKLVTDTEKVVPFILANREDFVSKKDIKESDEFKNKTVTFDKEIQEDTKLHTGHTFKINETTYTILIYGDVNQDGDVDVFDALTIQENAFESNLKEIQKVAANVVIADKSEMDVFDALAIQEYVGGAIDTILDEIPEEKEEQKPTPPTPPVQVETSKIGNFKSVDLTASQTYYRYDNAVVIGKVESDPNDIELKETDLKYIDYIVKKGDSTVGKEVASVTYKPNKTKKEETGLEEFNGTFNVEFYATEPGDYTIIPRVKGKNNEYITKDEVITFSVKENLEVTDIEIELADNKKIALSAGEILNPSNKIEVSAGKTKSFTIKLYHKYSQKEKPEDITSQVLVNNIYTIPNGTNSSVKFIKSDTSDIKEDGDKLSGDETVHIGFIQVTSGNTQGTDTITMKFDNSKYGGKTEETFVFNVVIKEKAEISGVTTNGTSKAETINVDLYTGKPISITQKNIDSASNVGSIYNVVDDNGKKLYEINETSDNKIYTIIPLKLIDTENDTETIQYGNWEKILKNTTTGQEGKVTLTVDSDISVEINSRTQQLRIGDIEVIAYNITGDTSQPIYKKCISTDDTIDAIGIAIPTSGNVNDRLIRLEAAKDRGFEIVYWGSTKIPTPISIKIIKDTSTN